MSSPLNFATSWNKWYRMLRYRKGFGLFDSLLFVWPVADVRVKQVHACSGIANN